MTSQRDQSTFLTMNCLIAGATGLIGSHALKLLLDSPKVHQVVSVARKSLPPHPKLKQVVVTFGALDNEQLPKCDVALCALGTTIKAAGSQKAFTLVDHDYVLAFARAARRAGVRKFVLVSALGADPSSRVFYSRTKGETERDIREIGFESVVILRPSLLIGERRESRSLEKMAILMAPLYQHLLVGPLKQYTPVRANKVAEVMVALALEAKTGVFSLQNAEIIAFSEENSF